MHKITALTIQQKDKERVNLFINGEFFCGVPIELVYKYQLKVNLELSSEQLQEILKESSYKEALSKGVNYLSKCLKTKRQVKDYLVKKNYDENVVWQVVDRLKEIGLIDDVEFSKRYIESASFSQGRRMIEFKLMSKGVKKEDILCAYEQLNVNYDNSARYVAEKYIKNKERTKENFLKTYKYLIGKGFSYDEAQSAVSFLQEDL